MKKTELLNEIKASYFSKKLSIFVGAGISLGEPSCIPVANELKKNIINGLIYETSFASPLLSHSDDIGLENLIGTIGKYNPGFVKNFMSLIASYDQSNWLHKSIKLISSRSGVCATTNFDCLLEHAFVIGHDGYKIYTPSRENDFTKREESSEQVLIKLHGSCDEEDIEKLGITLKAIGNSIVSTGTSNACRLLDKLDILFLGYRGRDIDVMVPMSAGSGRIFWCWHSSGEEYRYAANNKDNPVASAFCRKRSATQFEWDTKAFLIELLRKLDLDIPKEEYANRDGQVLFDKELYTLIEGITINKKKLIASELLHEIGSYQNSIEVVSNIELSSATKKINLQLLLTKNHKEMNNKDSFANAESCLGKMDLLVNELPSKNKRSFYQSKANSIKSFMMLYKGNAEIAYSISMENLKFFRKNIGNEDEMMSYDEAENLVEIFLSLADSLYYLSYQIGDRFDYRIIESCRYYIRAYLLSKKIGNIHLQTRALENMAHTFNKVVFENASENKSILTKLQFGIKFRLLSLYYQEFSGNDTAKSRSNINISYDYSRVGENDSAIQYATRRLTQSIRSNDGFGMAISLECIADSYKTENELLSNEFYNASEAAYIKACENPSEYVANIEYKKTNSFKQYDFPIRDYYSMSPELIEMEKYMEKILNSEDFLC